MNKKKGIIIAAAAAVVLTALLLVLIFVPKGENKAEEDVMSEPASISSTTDKDGVHQAQVMTDKDGNFTNGYGNLMEYEPAAIKTIHIENEKGSLDIVSETPKGEATVYTIKGYEGFDLQGGNPNLIANAAAQLSFSKIATIDKSKGADFGFDKPRSVVTIDYNDNTKEIVTVGSDAPQQAGTYIKFGTGDAVFVADTDTISAFDYGITDLISRTVNDAAENTENNQASSVKLSGTGFKKEIDLVPNTNINYSETFKMTAPAERLANEKESSLVAGGIRGLLADEVKMVNPSESQLKELGLDDPHAHITAVYPDTAVDLISTKPDDEGNVLLMASGKKVVYQLPASKVAWADTSYEKLCGEYICSPVMTKLSGISVKADGKTYDFKLKTRESTVTDNNGSETTSTTTTVTYGGKEIELGKFTDFYNKISLIGLADASEEKGGSDALIITYTFEDGSSDKASFAAADEKYAAKLNGQPMGHSSKGDVTRALNGVAEVIK